MEHKYLEAKVKAREVGRAGVMKVVHHCGIIGDVARSIDRDDEIADRSSSATKRHGKIFDLSAR